MLIGKPCFQLTIPIRAPEHARAPHARTKKAFRNPESGPTTSCHNSGDYHAFSRVRPIGKLARWAPLAL